MKMRPGLQAQFLLLMAVALLAVVGLIGLQLHRQYRMQLAVEQLSSDAMLSMATVGVQRRGESTVAALAD